jgi:uncharacterized RDD family membrane protein YckC
MARIGDARVLVSAILMTADSRVSLLSRRLAAYLLDCVLLFACLLVLQALLTPVNPITAIMTRGETFAAWQLHLWVFATATIPFLLYFATTITSRRQATLAMRWLGLRVVDLGGGRLSLGRAMLRSAILLVPFELNHTVMFHLSPGAGREGGPIVVAAIAAVWILILLFLGSAIVSPLGQSIHDRVAGTRVIRSSPPADHLPIRSG